MFPELTDAQIDTVTDVIRANLLTHSAAASS
jgi:hypothetical protein